jgi:hypothetical protein
VASDVGLLDVDHYLPGVLVFVAVLVAAVSVVTEHLYYYRYHVFP